jgi:radical SAM superfamily enzyme YgiQ (UPF0313 family)
MKVLFVYPEFPATYWSFKHALVIEGKRSAFPPLGLLTISAMLPQNWERRLVDLNIEQLKEKDLEWADMVFLSAMIVQKESLFKVIEKCRKIGKRVVIGGPYVSTSHSDLDNLGADHIFIGEVEETFPQFLKDLERGEGQSVYLSDLKPDLTVTPVPDFSIAKLNKYGAMCVQYSRGCPFQCEFCDIIEIYGRVPRTKSNEQMLAELDALQSAGWRGLVFMVDDNFIGNKRNVRNFLPELIKWSERNKFPFTFITEASVNLAEDDQLLQMMQDAGFSRVFLGIETPVEESLIESHKGQNTRRDLLESVQKIQSYGMEVMAGFIVGFDNDPKDIFERQIKFIRESGIPLAMVGLLNALPGTQLWRRLKKEGRLLWESRGDNTDCSLNFIPRMDAARLIEGYKHILSTIYSPQEYYHRALDCLRWIKQESVYIQYDGLVNKAVVFTYLLLKLGVFDRERKEFWRYFRQVLAEHRKRFAYAMVLAAMGYHFRQLTEDFNR